MLHVVLSLLSYYIVFRHAWPRLLSFCLVLISLCWSCLSLVDLTRAILSWLSCLDAPVLLCLMLFDAMQRPHVILFSTHPHRFDCRSLDGSWNGGICSLSPSILGSRTESGNVCCGAVDLFVATLLTRRCSEIISPWSHCMSPESQYNRTYSTLVSVR